MDLRRSASGVRWVRPHGGGLPSYRAHAGEPDNAASSPGYRREVPRYRASGSDVADSFDVTSVVLAALALGAALLCALLGSGRRAGSAAG
ncbi:hypothetical protein ACH4U6_30330 [Streptomyces netropsis]|uniref:hypothetical protein n=1 Tax=Streptomyces netropsis TaxID=55404 RepID=UPI0037A6120A